VYKVIYRYKIIPVSKRLQGLITALLLLLLLLLFGDITMQLGHAVAQLVEALRYKPEG
jgi:hypothetical protein